MILKEEKEEYHIEILSNDIEKFNITYKIGLFGDNEVGKTSLLKKVVNNEFCDYYDKTIQYTILYIYLRLNNDIIQLQIWDTAGDFSSISFLLPKLQLAILCYSIENKESFENIEKWLKSVKNLAKSNIKIFLVGNKCDLKNRVITMDEGKIFQQQNSLDYFIENSAKIGYKSRNIFIEAAKCLFKKNNEERDENEIDRGINESFQREHNICNCVKCNLI
jgi:small GTP-binding protein